MPLPGCWTLDPRPSTHHSTPGALEHSADPDPVQNSSLSRPQVPSTLTETPKKSFPDLRFTLPQPKIPRICFNMSPNLGTKINIWGKVEDRRFGPSVRGTRSPRSISRNAGIVYWVERLGFGGERLGCFTIHGRGSPQSPQVQGHHSRLAFVSLRF